MVLVCGTSTCHMAVSREKLFIPGVWGPFWSGTYTFFGLYSFFLINLTLISQKHIYCSYGSGVLAYRRRTKCHWSFTWSHHRKSCCFSPSCKSCCFPEYTIFLFTILGETFDWMLKLSLFCTCRCLGFLQKYLCLNSWTTFWKLWPKIRVLHLYLPLRQTCISFPTFTETGDLNRDRCSVSSLLSVIHSKLCYRSPVADPNSKGVIFGMSLDTSEKQLALLYLATIQGIAYGTRHIVEHCNAHGHKVCFLRLSSQIVL